MTGREWIWIGRWGDFQHYRPERDRPPAWIKDYTKQLHDPRYLQLSDRQRALLADLRRVFAVTVGRVPRSSAVITRHRHRQTFRSDLEALNHAGFIEFVSRKTLERRLDLLYSSPRARVEVEVEVEIPSPTAQAAGSVPCKKCGEPVPYRASCKACGAAPRAAGSNPRALGKPAPAARESNNDLPPKDPEALARLQAIASRIGRPV